jgi:hypothetical protein
MFECRVDIHSNQTLANESRRRAGLKLTLVSGELRMEPDYFGLEIYMRRGGSLRASVINVSERLTQGDSLLASLNLPDLLPDDFPLIIGGKLILLGLIAFFSFIIVEPYLIFLYRYRVLFHCGIGMHCPKYFCCFYFFLHTGTSIPTNINC